MLVSGFEFKKMGSESKSKKRVAYVFEDGLADATDSIPHLYSRSNLVHHLIQAFGLTELMDIKTPSLATKDDLLTFHSTAYLEYLKSNDEQNPEFEKGKDLSEFFPEPVIDLNFENEFGLGYDCPVFHGMTKFAYKITGGTLRAVDALIVDEPGYDIAINWCGGWHHAQRDEASGFCYVNDIVIGIQKLLKKFQRVLYIDVDAHHGDGVENAFSYSSKVMTLSFHNHEAGYYPGSGSVTDIGAGRGKYYSTNVPFQSGLVDEQFTRVFKTIFDMVFTKFQPDVMVVQCGADCMSGDPLGTFNLTEVSLSKSVQSILEKNKPTIFLGGGGYNLVNTAKLWTTLTSVILGADIPQEIPDHEYFLKYGPDYTLQISKSLRKNQNTESYLEDILDKVKCNLDSL